MLTLTKKSEYGLTALCHLAMVAPDKIVSARDIAERQNVPLPLLMNVLKTLNQAGFISSVRGAHGGYRMAVDPATVSLSDLVEAIEGPVRFVPCAPTSEHADLACERTGICMLRKPLHHVHEKFREFLRHITIADLAGEGAPYVPGVTPPQKAVSA